MDLKNKRAAVLGYGRSNRPLTEYLLSQGATVTVHDRKPREAFCDDPLLSHHPEVTLICGEEYLDRIDADIIFRTPGIRPDHKGIADACAHGAILTSEMEYFLAHAPATVLAVTGSDGKTTSTTLTGLLLEAECRRCKKGRVFVGGNIGKPLLPELGGMTADDFAVVELSSFQLQTFASSPLRAALTNVSPNHLDWHREMDEYITAKTNIYRHAGNTLLVTNADNEITGALAQAHGGKVTLFSRYADALPRRDGECVYRIANGCIERFDGTDAKEIIRLDELQIPGLHNAENAMTALALTEGLVSLDTAREVLRSFRGVRHRLERVRELDGVVYYNSSIDTSPTRTAAALSALAPIKPIIICGGYDKKIPFDPLAEALYAHAGRVILTGATREKIYRALQAVGDPARLGVMMADNFADAVCAARKTAQTGDTVLLSPACAAFDAFTNFEERGDTFCRMVNEF